MTDALNRNLCQVGFSKTQQLFTPPQRLGQRVPEQK
jgi:hypothetical protein